MVTILPKSLLPSTKIANTNVIKHDQWKHIQSQRVFLDQIAKTLNITNQNGWYRVTLKTLLQHGGSELLELYNDSTSKLLSTVYPEYLYIIPNDITLRN